MSLKRPEKRVSSPRELQSSRASAHEAERDSCPHWASDRKVALTF
jgi:hypothetical protein